MAPRTSGALNAGKSKIVARTLYPSHYYNELKTIRTQVCHCTFKTQDTWSHWQILGERLKGHLSWWTCCSFVLIIGFSQSPISTQKSCFSLSFSLLIPFPFYLGRIWKLNSFKFLSSGCGAVGREWLPLMQEIWGSYPTISKFTQLIRM